ncbi:hypothetical protein, partial [Roseinatronobacter sp.]|uniref:hypothetical protein n=1 Tax=Roseinatronobacter sp. TaxID=1945755 RepID=UPI0025FCB90D
QKENRLDLRVALKTGAGQDREAIARDPRPFDQPHPLTLAEIVGTLARLTEKWLITLSLRLEEGGGFVISGGQMPFLRYRPNRGPEILAPDFSDSMQKLADDLGLRVDLVPAPGGPQMTAEIAEAISATGPSPQEEDGLAEELDHNDSPDL